MTRTEKIAKLANAIRAYAGALIMTPRGKQWIRTPQNAAADRVRTWAKRLGLDGHEVLRRVSKIQNAEDFEVWLRTL